MARDLHLRGQDTPPTHRDRLLALSRCAWTLTKPFRRRLGLGRHSPRRTSPCSCQTAVLWSPLRPRGHSGASSSFPGKLLCRHRSGRPAFRGGPGPSCVAGPLRRDRVPTPGRPLSLSAEQQQDRGGAPRPAVLPARFWGRFNSMSLSPSYTTFIDSLNARPRDELATGWLGLSAPGGVGWWGGLQLCPTPVSLQLPRGAGEQLSPSSCPGSAPGAAPGRRRERR